MDRSSVFGTTDIIDSPVTLIFEQQLMLKLFKKKMQ